MRAAEAKKAFESLPEDVQVAAKRAELDRTLPVLSAILQEVGGVGVIAWAAYLDVMEGGNCDPFDMREIVEAVAPRLEREQRERIRNALQPLFDAIDSPDGEVPPFQPISDAAQRAYAYLALDSQPQQHGEVEEDADDLCSCGHERFHHEDGREMGVYSNCKAHGCTCQQFQHHVPAVKTNDRERMADDLEVLGLYATSNAVRASRATLAEGVAHVQRYCLPRILSGIEEVRARNAASPPIPGTVGASMLGNCEARRDELQRFLDDWAVYNFTQPRDQERDRG